MRPAPLVATLLALGCQAKDKGGGPGPSSPTSSHSPGGYSTGRYSTYESTNWYASSGYYADADTDSDTDSDTDADADTDTAADTGRPTWVGQPGDTARQDTGDTGLSSSVPGGSGAL